MSLKLSSSSLVLLNFDFDDNSLVSKEPSASLVISYLETCVSNTFILSTPLTFGISLSYESFSLPLSIHLTCFNSLIRRLYLLMSNEASPSADNILLLAAFIIVLLVKSCYFITIATFAFAWLMSNLKRLSIILRIWNLEKSTCVSSIAYSFWSSLRQSSESQLLLSTLLWFCGSHLAWADN